MNGARDQAIRRIARRVLQFPDLEISSLETEGLAPRDAALASAIDHAVARRWLTLRALLRPRLRRPWDKQDPTLRAVLLAGAAQCLLLDRVPDHAAISESVASARRLVRPQVGGLVNAVLRQLVRSRVELVDDDDPERRDVVPRGDGRAWRFDGPVLADDPLRRRVERTSTPRALLARWRDTCGATTAAALAEHGMVTPPIIVTGLDPGAPDCTPHEEPGFHVFTGSRADLAALLERTPSARVQDPAAAAPVEATRGLPATVILDVCAGRGTKTMQLAAVHPAATIVATDVDAERRAVLRATFAASERIRVIDPPELDAWAGRADLLLLDVPCTNTGVLARRVEARYRFSRASLDRLVAMQREIVTGSMPLLADRGHLLLATCSIDGAENGEQADWIERHFGLEPPCAGARMPRGRPGDPPTAYADGSYHALFRRA